MMPTQQTIPIRSHVKLDARVMSGSDFVATQTCRQSIARRKLQSAIATDARNRRFAVEIARHKRCDHVTFEITFEIQYVKRKSKLFRYTTRVVHVVQRTATRRQRITVFIDVDTAPLVPQLHRETDQVVSLVFQYCS